MLPITCVGVVASATPAAPEPDSAAAPARLAASTVWPATGKNVTRSSWLAFRTVTPATLRSSGCERSANGASTVNVVVKPAPAFPALSLHEPSASVSPYAPTASAPLTAKRKVFDAPTRVPAAATVTALGPVSVSEALDASTVRPATGTNSTSTYACCASTPTISPAAGVVGVAVGRAIVSVVATAIASRHGAIAIETAPVVRRARSVAVNVKVKRLPERV